MPADERKAVRVDPGRGESDDGVTLLDPCSVDQSVTIHDTDGRPAKVELLVTVDPGQLRRLPSENRAAGGSTDVGGALDELGDLLDVDRVRRDVVEQEERLGTRREHVVDAVGGEVGAAPAQPAARGGASTSLDPTESVDAASRRRSSIANSPAKAPNAPATPAVAVEATAARRRSVIASAVSSETPAAA